MLSELPYAITGGTFITVEDLQQELVCNINIKHRFVTITLLSFGLDGILLRIVGIEDSLGMEKWMGRVGWVLGHTGLCENG